MKQYEHLTREERFLMAADPKSAKKSKVYAIITPCFSLAIFIYTQNIPAPQARR